MCVVSQRKLGWFTRRESCLGRSTSPESKVLVFTPQPTLLTVTGRKSIQPPVTHRKNVQPHVTHEKHTASCDTWESIRPHVTQEKHRTSCDMQKKHRASCDIGKTYGLMWPRKGIGPHVSHWPLIFIYSFQDHTTPSIILQAGTQSDHSELIHRKPHRVWTPKH